MRAAMAFMKGTARSYRLCTWVGVRRRLHECERVRAHTVYREPGDSWRTTRYGRTRTRLERRDWRKARLATAGSSACTFSCMCGSEMASSHGPYTYSARVQHNIAHTRTHIHIYTNMHARLPRARGRGGTSCQPPCPPRWSSAGSPARAGPSGCPYRTPVREVFVCVQVVWLSRMGYECIVGKRAWACAGMEERSS